MTPFGFWLIVITGSSVYNVAKYFILGSLDIDGFVGAAMWVGYAMIALHYGWVSK